MNLNLSRFRSALALLLCLVVVGGWFAPWWAAGRVLAPVDLQHEMMSPWRGERTGAVDVKNHIVSDGVDQYLVYRMIAERDLRREGRVGWSSLTYGGTAQYANTMALYDDWTMHLHRWLDFWTAWHLGIMAQVAIAVAGMFFFLRQRAIGQLWSACGALAYGANSQFVTWIYHRWALGAFCWVPWILWAIDRHRGGRRAAWSLVPIFIALAFLGGTLQHAALVVMTVAAMWGDEALPMGWNARDQARLLGKYLVWGGLGVGLAAMMFLPCADAFLTSNRLGLHTGMTTHVANSIYPQGPLQPLFNLAAYPLQCFPSLLGGCDSLDVLKLFKSELWYVAYFGSLPVLIAFFAPWRKDSPMVARILILCGLLLPLTPLVRVLYQRLFLLFIFGGILAFAHYMETATRESRLRAFKILACLMGSAIACWTIASIFLHVNPNLLLRLKGFILVHGKGSSFGYFESWLSNRADRFIDHLFVWSPHQLIPIALLILGLAGFRLAASMTEAWRRCGALMVTLAVICEVSLFGTRWVAWSDPGKYPLFPETAESKVLHDIVGTDGRVSTLIHPDSHMALTPFVPNTLAAYRIATISGYDSIVPNGMLLPNEAPGDAQKLGRFGVSHIITWTGNPEVPQPWQRVWQSPMMALYENPLRYPRYGGLSSAAAKDQFFAGQNVEMNILHETSGLENQRRIEAPAGIAWIRIAENYGAGWQYRAAADDTWRPVMQAPDAGILLENPTADQPVTIEMRYEPPLRRLGWQIAIFAALSTMVGGILSIRAVRSET